MKKVTFLLISILISFYSNAQINKTWENKNFKRNISSIKTTQLSDSSIVFGKDDNLVKLSNNGDSVGYATFNPDFRVARNFAAANGYFFVAGQNNGTASIAKYNNDLTFQSAKELGSGFGYASYILRHNNKNFVSGYLSNTLFVMRFDDNLDTLWSIFLPQSTFTNFSKIIPLNDGNYLASGNLDDYPILLKFDENGDTLWTFYEPIFISFSQSNVYEKSNGNIVAVNGGHKLELDAQGNKVSEENYFNRYFEGLVSKTDTIYLFGSCYLNPSRTERALCIELRDLNFDSLTTYLDTGGMSLSSNNLFSDATVLHDGGILTVGNFKTLADVTNNTYSLVALKFNTPQLNISVQDILNEKNQFEVYPNPANQYLTISTQTPQNYYLYSLTGSIIDVFRVTDHQTTVDLGKLNQGIYWLYAEKSKQPKKIVVY